MDSKIPLTHSLNTAIDFFALMKRTDCLTGFLEPLEGYALFLLAAQGDGVGEIVEIGSLHGKSTSWLASGSKGAGREKVTAVDVFSFIPDPETGIGWPSLERADWGRSFNVFERNIKAMGLWDWVNPVIATSEEASKSWDKPIRLLFIDASHTYENVGLDFQYWTPHLVPEGWVAFHDYQSEEGVHRFVDELVGDSASGFEFVLTMNDLALTRRIRG
jgi:hypothetical protein